MRQVEIPWGHNKVAQDSVVGAEVVAFHFKTPATVPGAQGGATLVEYNGPPGPRDGCLSTVAGDVAGANAVGSKANANIFAGENAPSVVFRGDAPIAGPHPKPGNQPPQLQPNTDYYLNVQNTPGNAGGGVLVNLKGPRG